MIGQKYNNTLKHLLIVVVGALLFLPFLGNVALFDWDEVNFAEIAREMIVTGDYLNVQINYQPFWEKPPLFIWMQALSMKLFGINEFAARFPNAICGITTLLVIFAIGKKIHNAKMGLTWVLVYAGSILPFFYFKSGIIDPWFNLFIFLGIYFAITYIDRSRVQLFNGSIVNEPDISSFSPTVLHSNSHKFLHSPGLLVFLSGAAIGLAILTKGPVALLIFGLVAIVFLFSFILTNIKKSTTSQNQISKFPNFQIISKSLSLFAIGLLLTGGSWFLIMIASGHLDVVIDFIVYQVRLFSTKDAGHGGFPGYHVVILMLGVFPASAFLFGGLKAGPEENFLQKNWRRVMIILLATVVVLFEIVQTKIVHYSSLAYFPLTYLAALAIYRTGFSEKPFSRSSRIILWTLAILWMTVIAGFTLVGLNKVWLMNSGLIKDPFAVANLAADIRWTGFETLVALALIPGIAGFFMLKKPFHKTISLFGASLVFTFLTMTIFTGKIEGYVQRAPIEFYEKHSSEECYINTLGYKSYAHLFYGKKMPPVNPLSYDKEWLLNGKIDKTAYFVYKITKKEEYSRLYPQLTVLYEKNGFIFAARYPE
ncbi:MAG: glycosyltransferase family 39 protein [Bacteroidales bacterium]|nr:glycosyltransferase family 39 protein [Bacteroidales bacterium]